MATAAQDSKSRAIAKIPKKRGSVAIPGAAGKWAEQPCYKVRFV
jgi:hypothetical protein